MSTANRETVDGCDHWLRYAANEAMEAFNFKHARFGGAVIAERSALFLISAGAESFISSAGEDDGAYRGVDPGVGEGGEQFIDRTATHRGIAIWAVDGDDGGAIAHLVENVGELGWLKHVDPFAIEAIIRGFGDRQKKCQRRGRHVELQKKG